MAKNQYLDIILATAEWHENKVKQLQHIADKGDESKIKFKGKDGDTVDLPEDHKKGFIMGIKLALEVIGEFPVKIGKEE